MGVYIQVRCCGLILFHLCLLNIVISTHNSRNASDIRLNLTSTITNVTSSLEVDVTDDYTCGVNDNCTSKTNKISVGVWFCNETTHRCQLQCPSGYKNYKNVCTKPQKGALITRVVVNKPIPLKFYDTSVKLGSSCGLPFHSCAQMSADCLNGRCQCRSPYPVADYIQNRCLKFVYVEGGTCKISEQCIGGRKCKNYICQGNTDIRAQTEAFMLGFGIFVIILLFFVSVLGCIGRRRFQNRRHRRRARAESVPYTSSTLELMAEFRQPPPSYAEVFMVGRNQVVTKPPSYEEAVRETDTGWTSATLQVPTNSAPTQGETTAGEIGGSLVMGESSTASANVESLRSELRRYPRDNQITVREDVPVLVDSNV